VPKIARLQHATSQKEIYDICYMSRAWPFFFFFHPLASPLLSTARPATGCHRRVDAIRLRPGNFVLCHVPRASHVPLDRLRAGWYWYWYWYCVLPARGSLSSLSSRRSQVVVAAGPKPKTQFYAAMRIFGSGELSGIGMERRPCAMGHGAWRAPNIQQPTTNIQLQLQLHGTPCSMLDAPCPCSMAMAHGTRMLHKGLSLSSQRRAPSPVAPSFCVLVLLVRCALRASPRPEARPTASSPPATMQSVMRSSQPVSLGSGCSEDLHGHPS
jgi:hypothetical protein